ncbi:putative efflux protein, MATE family [Desulfitobacterium dichloroeliminans LMG P-21439]|uniref:Probable multidrug resistance protein NorM n=1 Tax=Desulfitobacterium dichloroeliminans (strain LMG P-21439 / DCA1) TaxID=871963 RepID=L0F9W0_DESDL|nr:MATE family efflux transporter [Desulfitobacterium dichloroeliminans]AGA69446.1 putative efflux protein, MATE family [Desulfitobacterium dichloroeliminans LMG P-21439]
MEQTHSIRQKVYQFIRILFPILISQVALFSMTFFDTMMSGQASSLDLAGVAIGGNLWMPTSTGLGGILIAITPIVGHLSGAQRKSEISGKVMQGLYLALVISGLLILIGTLSLDWIISQMNLEVQVVYIARGYLMAIAFGIPPYFIYQILRGFIDALGKTRITMVITLLSLPINIFLNYIFIFGKLGLPHFGGIGAGIATSLTYYCLTIIAIFTLHRHPYFSEYKLFGHFPPSSWQAWREHLTMGIPIGLSIFLETSIFSAVTLLMSSFNTLTIAAHQSAMNFASMIYMVPLSFSMALTILVGFEVGARRLRDARHYSFIGLGFSFSMAVLTAFLLFLFREQVAALYSKEQDVIQLAQHFLIYAIFFQFSDSIATPIQGILRGYKDVNVPFITALLSYWLVALPTGYFLATTTFLGAFGFWVGLITGITLNACCLVLRLKFIQAKQVKVPSNL